MIDNDPAMPMEYIIKKRTMVVLEIEMYNIKAPSTHMISLAIRSQKYRLLVEANAFLMVAVSVYVFGRQ